MAEKAMAVKDLRGLPDADIRGQLEKLRKDLWQTRIKAKDGALQQTHELRILRRQIARVETVLTERRTQGTR